MDFLHASLPTFLLGALFGATAAFLITWSVYAPRLRNAEKRIHQLYKAKAKTSEQLLESRRRADLAEKELDHERHTTRPPSVAPAASRRVVPDLDLDAADDPDRTVVLHGAGAAYGDGLLFPAGSERS